MKDCDVLPFTVEVDLPRNGHLMVQSLPGRPTLRSAFDNAKSVKRGGRGSDANDDLVPKTQLDTFGGHPRLPGQQLYINPGELTYEITDPMYGNKELCEKLHRWMEQQLGFATERNGFPPKEGKLDVHRMKTLCYEILGCIEKGDVKVIKGVAPERVEIDDMPGYELLNPGATIHTSQPRFKKDFEEWEARLNGLERVS